MVNVRRFSHRVMVHRTAGLRINSLQRKKNRKGDERRAFASLWATAFWSGTNQPRRSCLEGWVVCGHTHGLWRGIVVELSTKQASRKSLPSRAPYIISAVKGQQQRVSTRRIIIPTHMLKYLYGHDKATARRFMVFPNFSSWSIDCAEEQQMIKRRIPLLHF